MGSILNPLIIFWILLTLSYIFYRFRFYKTCKGLIVFALFELFLFTVTPFPVFLARQLEQEYRFNEAQYANKALPILVLGGGHTNDPTMPHFARLNESALTRVIQGVMLYRALPGRKFICSGFSFTQRIPNAAVMANTAVGLGIKPQDTLLLVNSGCTWEEARDYKKRFGADGNFFLVTSAIHMPRAMETFRSMGLRPIAVPTNYMVKKEPDKSFYSWKPSWSKLYMSERALHEYFGIWYYRIFK